MKWMMSKLLALLLNIFNLIYEHLEFKRLISNIIIPVDSETLSIFLFACEYCHESNPINSQIINIICIYIHISTYKFIIRLTRQTNCGCNRVTKFVWLYSINSSAKFLNGYYKHVCRSLDFILLQKVRENPFSVFSIGISFHVENCLYHDFSWNARVYIYLKVQFGIF